MILGVDQSSAQLLILNSQLSYLKGRYWQLTGLEAVTDKKTPRLHHNNGESSQCFPRKQVTTNSPPVFHYLLFIFLQIAFAKTHKTGSSTLQNIFFRYGDRNNLNFALPEKSWMFSYKQPFNASMVNRLPWARLGFDMFIFHRWHILTRL